jgi:hypothetical protein
MHWHLQAVETALHWANARKSAANDIISDLLCR